MNHLFSTEKFIKQGFKLTLFLALSFIFVVPAQAVQYRGTGGRPAYPRADNPRTESIFVHVLEPGDEKLDGIRVINNDAETKTLLVYAADATPSSSGGFACKQLLDTQTGVGSWITLEKNEVTLEPGTNEVVNFTIAVPDNADVGEQNGCILIQEKDDREVDEDRPAGMHLSFRTGLRVAITVPGQLIRKLELAGFTIQTRKNQPGFLYTSLIKNIGNVSTDTNIIIKTTNVFGREISQHGGEYTILRGDASELNFEVEKPFWGGWYNATLSAEYDPNPETEIGTRSGEIERLTGESYWYFSKPALPALLIELATLAIILGIFTFIFIVQKRKSWVKKTWVAYEVKTNDDIKTIAEKHAVSWKVLAKANNLTPPYTLHKGQDIIVPPEEKGEAEKTIPKNKSSKDSNQRLNKSSEEDF